MGITVKQKPCKGTGKAKGCGCKTPSYHKRYGLCEPCYINWLRTTPEGNLLLSKSILHAPKKVAKINKQATRQEKISIKKKSDYEGELQLIVNHIARIIDAGKGCISCMHGWDCNFTRAKHGGHRISVGSNASLRFNLWNIWLQCVQCNHFKGGNERAFDKGLLTHYGQLTVDKVVALKAKYPELHLSLFELRNAIMNAKDVRSRILNGEDFTRDEINSLIGIYN